MNLNLANLSISKWENWTPLLHYVLSLDQSLSQTDSSVFSMRSEMDDKQKKKQTQSSWPVYSCSVDLANWKDYPKFISGTTQSQSSAFYSIIASRKLWQKRADREDGLRGGTEKPILPWLFCFMKPRQRIWSSVRSADWIKLLSSVHAAGELHTDALL